MKLIKLNCIACGAPVSVSDDLKQFNCDTCGSLLAIQREAGEISVRLLKNLSKAIDKSSAEIQSAIHNSSQLTQLELQNFQLKHELTSLETQLANIQSELRGLKLNLDNNPKNYGIQQSLYNLHYQEYGLLERIRQVKHNQASLNSDNLESDIGYFQSQLSLLNASIVALKKSAKRIRKYKKQYQTLLSEKERFSRKLKDAQIKEITDKLNSYKFTFDQHPTKKQLIAYGEQLDQDILKTREMGNAPQASRVIRDLRKKKNENSQKLLEIERERVKNLLISLQKPLSRESSLAQLKDELENILADIDKLSSQPSNYVVTSELQRLKRNQKRYQRYINQKEGKTLWARMINWLASLGTSIKLIMFALVVFPCFCCGLVVLFDSNHVSEETVDQNQEEDVGMETLVASLLKTEVANVETQDSLTQETLFTPESTSPEAPKTTQTPKPTATKIPTSTNTPLPSGETRDNPIPYGAPVDIGGDKVLKVMGIVRPADDIVLNANMFNEEPETGKEYLQVEIQIVCNKPPDKKCYFETNNLKTVGSDGNVLEEEIFVSGVEGMLEAGEFFGDATRTGKMFFMVDKGDENVVLFYEPLLFGSPTYIALP